MAPKNYSVKTLVTKADEPEITRLLAEHPLWKRKDARAVIARRRFIERFRTA